ARWVFVDARSIDVARDAVEHGARVLLRADAGEPFRTPIDDEGRTRERLHVVDGRGPSPESALRRERRLDARIGPLALDGFQQRGLLAADVRTGPLVQDDFRREIGPHDVAPDIALSIE